MLEVHREVGSYGPYQDVGRCEVGSLDSVLAIMSPGSGNPYSTAPVAPIGDGEWWQGLFSTINNLGTSYMQGRREKQALRAGQSLTNVPMLNNSYVQPKQSGLAGMSPAVLAGGAVLLVLLLK